MNFLQCPRLNIKSALFSLLAIISIGTGIFLLSSFAHAAGGTFTWVDPNNITVSGPGLSNGKLQKTTGNRFAGGVDTADNCRIFFDVNTTGPNSGVITVQPYYSGPVVGSPGTLKQCDNATAAKYFQSNQTIQIAGDPANAPETQAQKQVCVLMTTSDNPADNPPATIQVKVTGPGGEKTVTLNRATDVTSSSYYKGCLDLEPGDYQFCPVGRPEFQCQAFKKLKYQENSRVEFKAEGWMNKIIEGIVVADNLMCDPNTGKVLSSFTLQLKDKEGKLLQTESTEPVQNKTWEEAGTSSGACSVTFRTTAYFKDVDPGEYTVCLVDFDQCKTVTKQNDVRAQVVFTISGQDAQNALRNADEAESNKGVTCAIEKMGWMLCPILETVAKISDEAFKFLAGTLLQVEPELIKGDDASKGTFRAWSTFRDIANVAFVAAFLFLIYSQITGLGASNYGLKKMLPRLIVAAILVNASYYICQLAVDVTNILGFELKGWLTDIAKELYKESDNEYANVFEQGNLPLTVITVAVLGAAMVWILLPVLFTVATTVVISILMIIIILLLRKAFIVLLIVVSPIAFVAYLLPNTEGYYNKWRKMFVQLLMVFPIVSLLFGAGQLASAVIMTTGTDFTAPAAEHSLDSADTSGGDALTGEQQVDLSMGMVATGIAIAPLVAVYAVLKAAISSTGAIGGWVAARHKQGLKAGNSFGKKMDANSAYNRGKQIRAGLKKNYQQKKMLRRLGEKDTVMGRYTRAAIGGAPAMMPAKLRTPVMKAQAARFDRLATVAGKKIEDEELKEARSNLQRQGLDTNGLIQELQRCLSEGMSESALLGAKAAASQILTTGGASGVDSFAAAIVAMESAGIDTNSPQMKELKSHIVERHGNIEDKSSAIFSWAADKDIAHGTAQNMASHIASPDSYNYLSDKEITTQTPGSIQNMIAAGAIDRAKAQRILGSESGENLGPAQRQSLKNV